jgi:hypothetical protein
MALSCIGTAEFCFVVPQVFINMQLGKTNEGLMMTSIALGIGEMTVTFAIGAEVEQDVTALDKIIVANGVGGASWRRAATAKNESEVIVDICSQRFVIIVSANNIPSAFLTI